jgi:N-acetylmuramoyl-L-alanine amidase
VRPPGAIVTVNGVQARQAPGGGWLAWVPVSPGEFTFHVEARPSASGPRARSRPAGVSSPAEPALAALDRLVRVPGFQASWLGFVDTASVSPRVPMELHPGDPVRLSFKGAPGLEARALVEAAGRDSLAWAPFVEEPGAERNDGRSVFGPAGGNPSDSSGVGKRPASGPAWSSYRAEIRVPDAPRGPSPGAERDARGTPKADRSGPEGAGHDGSCRIGHVDSRPAPACASWDSLTIEVAGLTGPARYRIPGAALLVRPAEPLESVVLDDDPQGTGRTDGQVVARTAPDGVYFLFLPNGTRASADRRIGDSLELRLAEDLSVWVPIAEAHVLPAGTPAARARVPVVRTRPLGAWTRIVIPLEQPLPVQVRQQTDPVRYEVTIFGARAATEFIRTELADSLVRAIRWNQPASDRFVLEVELDQRQPWGFRYGYEGSDLYLDVRRAPHLRTGLFRSILKGLKIVVDPGHSPDAGATGPTGLQEKDVNLQVALELARQLSKKGAEVTLTRTGEAPEGFSLSDRTALAAREAADLLVSVHHNALPDGVNPFENNGSSTYYYQPQSLPLARAIQVELLGELGLSDFGVSLGNLALVRPTEMPAVLTEAAFMMIPEQEELLRAGEFRKREAKAIRKGIEQFLEEARRAMRGSRR